MKSSNSKIYRIFSPPPFCSPRQFSVLDSESCRRLNSSARQTKIRTSIGHFAGRARRRVEVSDERLIRAELDKKAKPRRSTWRSIPSARKPAEEGTEYEGRIIVKGEDIYYIPIRIIIFPFTPRECRGRQVSVQYLNAREHPTISSARKRLFRALTRFRPDLQRAVRRPRHR